ncbi:GNAT family N-acetyltransferase [Pseudonocardia sp. GCM10023141]|uniref:GNAT family N-acetyltransferase n=1 Tax=Pseudonocardia sp. GCM10023141 TaxID=3252653 RepID=UPI00362243B3
MITAMTAGEVDAVVAFFRSVPEGDLTFVKEDVDRASIAGWVDRPGQRWLSLDDGGAVTGFAAVLPFTGWSDHVGDVRLIVAPLQRGTGVGTALARHALTEAVRSGLKKLVVELPADQVHTIEMFSRLGFTGEALLRDHIRDRAGQLRDLVMLAHLVDDGWANLTTVGIADEPAN